METAAPELTARAPRKISDSDPVADFSTAKFPLADAASSGSDSADPDVVAVAAEPASSYPAERRSRSERMLWIPELSIDLSVRPQPDPELASAAWVSATQSLRPVANSVTETWQILKRAIPVAEPPHG
jgi:hypothetical protein